MTIRSSVLDQTRRTDVSITILIIILLVILILLWSPLAMPAPSCFFVI